MEPLENAYFLKRSGRFSEALRALASVSVTNVKQQAAHVLRAELLEYVGQHAQARALATTLLKSNRLTKSQQSACEYVMGRILLDDGDTDGAVAHLQRSASRAQEAADFERLHAAQLHLLVVVSERSGLGAATALLAEVRRLTTRLGDPNITATLHLFVAEMEAKRGLLENARRHTALARHIMGTFSNAYLEAFSENLELAMAVLRSQFDAGRACGDRAAHMAERSGVASIYRASLANLGNLFYAVGEFDRAIELFERALTALPSFGSKTNATLDSLARVHLTQGRLDDCADLLDQIDHSIRTEQDRIMYGHRYAALTRTQLLASQGRIQEAAVMNESVLELATTSGDALLLKRAQLTKAELLQQLGRIPAMMATIEAVVPSLLGESPELYAQCEQVLACALVSEGDARAGSHHYKRASRIYQSVRSVPGRIELERRWNQALSASQKLRPKAAEDAHLIVGRRALQGIAAVMAHAGRPELVALELVDVLATTGCVHTARATSRRADDAEEIIASVGDANAVQGEPFERRFSIGLEHDRAIQLVVQPREDVESAAGINALTLLLVSVQELERARLERDERATLWPVEDLPIDGDRSVISGHMRELMTFARRIAKTKVNVLITGDSGTGKEILARAIHTFSDRAQKPFVPFNCTAVPRDLLESQLFGHRRGAFTGADRDYAGLIRSAREGTLFLDEVGELGLDLQPKLLRFLESGEISPLGEPAPLTVDVRIVAATNTNLEDAVRAGKFREDLFYRLNVVRLSIRPLRERRDEIPGFVNHFALRAAEEFKKGDLRVAEETMERLLLYRWPGNVRQLQNEMRRMVALAEPNSTLMPDAISEDILGALPLLRHPPLNTREVAVSLHDKLMPTIARIECEMIKAALREHHGKMEAVAKALGISRKGLYLKRQRLGL